MAQSFQWRSQAIVKCQVALRSHDSKVDEGIERDGRRDQSLPDKMGGGWWKNTAEVTFEEKPAYGEKVSHFINTQVLG